MKGNPRRSRQVRMLQRPQKPPKANEKAYQIEMKELPEEDVQVHEVVLQRTDSPKVTNTQA